MRVRFRILWISLVRETTERRACLYILLRQSSNKAVGGLWEMILSCWFNDKMLCLSQQQNMGKEGGKFFIWRCLKYGIFNFKWNICKFIVVKFSSAHYRDVCRILWIAQSIFNYYSLRHSMNGHFGTSFTFHFQFHCYVFSRLYHYTQFKVTDAFICRISLFVKENGIIVYRYVLTWKYRAVK